MVGEALGSDGTGRGGASKDIDGEAQSWDVDIVKVKK